MTKQNDILRDYQYAAVRKMTNGCILNGGVGSGKSRTSLYYYFIESGLKGRDLYIITTARKRDTKEWEMELDVFLKGKHTEYGIIIDSWNNIKKYSNVYGAFFIFDEDRITGSGAWVKAFYKIAKKNKWIVLSATPGDTWSDYIPVFIANGFYKNKTEFTREHCVYSRFTKYPKIDRYLDQGKLNRYRNKILVNMDFKRPTIPNHVDVDVRYNPVEYKEIGKNRWNPFTNKPIKNANELCLTWRKLINSDISRQKAILDIFLKHPKLIIFYNFDYELDILRSLFKIDNIIFAEWNGHIHDPLPQGDSWVYAVQYNAGNEGWNCITTDTIVFYSQNYSYKIMTQAAGRIDRMNTPYVHLNYYHLKSKAPIDLAIARALKKKRNFNESRFVNFDSR